jgi:hypothetical protein
MKTDGTGQEIWTKLFGAGEVNWGLCAAPTSDGGYIIAGSTWGWGQGKSDILLLRTGADGNEIWLRTFGGKGKEHGFSVQEISEGGYIIAGQTASFGAGKDDVYLIKTDTDGSMVWAKTYGGKGTDRGYSVAETRDGGYVIAGETDSFSPGNMDAYLIKTDVEGNAVWSRTYGTKHREIGRSVVETLDGGYAVAGSTGGSEHSDIYLIKTDARGKAIWSRTYGGKYDEHGFSVQRTKQGGYFIVGNTWPFGRAGDSDVYVLQVNGDGNDVHSEKFGGKGFDCGYSVQPTEDGGFILVGETDSPRSGKRGVYLIKMAAGSRK